MLLKGTFELILVGSRRAEMSSSVSVTAPTDNIYVCILIAVQKGRCYAGIIAKM